MILIARPRLINQGPLCVIRGGCWSYYGRNCRSAYRFWRMPTDRDIPLSFRIVMKGKM